MKQHMKTLALAALIGCAFEALTIAPAAAVPFDHKNSNGRQLLVRAEAIETLAGRYGLKLLDSTRVGDNTLYLVEAPVGVDARALASRLAAEHAGIQAEAASLAALPAELASSPLLLEAAPDLSRTGTFATACEAAYLGDTWAGYADQRAARAIHLNEAHAASLFCGAGIKVAVIDTGVDEHHPLLASALLPGYDVFDSAGTGSDWSNLDHSVRAIVEHSVRAIVEHSVRAIVEESAQGQAFTAGSAAVLGEDAVLAFHDTTLPAYFGHGTMVAGLIRLVAPGARVVPIRAFDGDGTANVFDLVRAIYWATDNGANVINMSFSLSESPRELRSALRYAESHGVVLIAAAGNQGSLTRLYPAAYPEVLGAAAQSTAADGSLAAFSNYGPLVAEIAAPGSALITTFPGGLYAAAWGTSFSSPLVAGAAALLLERPFGTGCQVGREAHRDLLSGTAPRSALLGKVLSGQLDVYNSWLLAGN